MHNLFYSMISYGYKWYSNGFVKSNCYKLANPFNLGIDAMISESAGMTKLQKICFADSDM